MGKAGKLLVAVTVVAVAVFCYAFASAQLAATLVDQVVESAQDRRGTFDAMAQALDRGDLSAVQYRDLDGGAEHYAYVTYTVALDGHSLFPAEWAVLNLAPAEGDVVLIQGAPQDAPSFGGATLTATLLTKADQANAPRAMWAEYYVLGRALSAPVAVEP